MFQKLQESKLTYLALGILAGFIVAYAYKNYLKKDQIMLKKPIKKTPVNQSGLKQAYDLVTADLFRNLKKARDGAKIKLGDLGVFQKKLTKVTNYYGGFQYYRISFKVSEKLRGRNLD